MILGFLLACGEEDAGSEYTLAGTVESAGSTADVRNAVGFGVNAGGEAAIFISPNPDATCDDVAAYLGTSNVDPDGVNVAGACSLYVAIPDYAGSITVQDDLGQAVVSLGCAMDDGAWEYRTGNDEGYYYSGPWWTGTAEAFSLTVEGGDEADFELTLEMDDYHGSFTYDSDNPDPDPGTGIVTGTATAAWCPDMGPLLGR